MTAQTTIAGEVRLTGVGVHSGQPASLTLAPAAPDSGVVFSRADRDGEIELVADHRSVVATALSTVLGSERFGEVATVEHLMATVCGLGIDNLMVEIDGGEVPVLDGSAEGFVAAIEEVGLRRQATGRRFIRVTKPVRVMAGDAVGELVPHDGRRVDIEIEFTTPVIGHQVYMFDLDAGDFRRELARARTFGFMGDVERLWAEGFGLGASLDNTIVVGEDAVINPDGLRFADEFVRHKALDALGDLALAGAPIIGAYRSLRGGHRLNCAVLDALFADSDAWCWAESPARREAAHADVGALMPAAAYGPDVS